MNHIANRVATALISASFLVTAGLLLHTAPSLSTINLHTIGYISLGVGAFLALRLHWGIWRHGGM